MWCVAERHTRVEYGVKPEAEARLQKLGIRVFVVIKSLYRHFLKTHEKRGLDTNLNNLRAQHVYECLGFQKMRVNYDSWTDQLGQLQSSVAYELIPHHFRDLSDNPDRQRTAST